MIMIKDIIQLLYRKVLIWSNSRDEAFQMNQV